MRRAGYVLLGAVVLVGLGLQAVPSGAGALRRVQPRPILTGADLSPDAARIVARACTDCHSDNTLWPWYSRVAPMSWLMETDVERGRKFLNLSNWETYSRGRKMGYLMAIHNAVKNQTMPLHSYMFLHPDAKLTDDEAKVLMDWTVTERKRLRKPPAS